MENHEKVVRDSSSLRIYTDGSGIDYKIGASAYAPQLGVKLKSYLGSMDHFTVYSEELVGIDLACQLGLDAETPNLDIFVDNQASIQATIRPKNSSGQYIIRRICTKVTKLMVMGTKVTFHWIPAHEGVPGNEVADRLAKEATGWIEKGTGTDPMPTGGPSLLSAAKQRIRKLVHEHWDNAWEACEQGADLKRHVDLSTKDKRLKKSVSSVITQLRTKITLKDLLFKYGKVESPLCSYRAGRQTAAHLLLSCRNFREDRWNIWGLNPTDLTSILITKELAVKAAKFIIRTRLLKVFQFTYIGDEDDENT